MASCALCNDLTKRHEDHLGLNFEFTLKQLNHSAVHHNCSSCLILWEGLRQARCEDWTLFEQRTRIIYARCLGEHGGFAETLQLIISFLDDSPSLQLEFYSLVPHTSKAILPRPTISSHPLSAQGLAWARSHLDRCKSSHISCKTSRLKMFPKRLVKLQKQKDGQIEVELVEVKSDSIDVYAALSHCWGRERGYVTTKYGLKSNRKTILWEAIPRTFQDAMRFAMRLNIGHIWIDSFCIVQDDKKDWEIESAKMADIYQHAIVTLAATTSSGDTEGCFSTNLSSVKHTEIMLSGGKTSGIAVRQRLRHWNKTTANDPVYFPLLSRGWVLQERLLSTRVLHFCASELIWECREESDCECGGLNQDRSPGSLFHNLTARYEMAKNLTDNPPIVTLSQSFWARTKRRSQICKGNIGSEESQLDKSTAEIHRSSLRRSWFAPTPAIQVGISSTNEPTKFSRIDAATPFEARSIIMGEDDIPDFVPHYHRLVEQYTALKLTRATDRLAAFSGICARIQHFRGHYLAGLWSDSLCFDLMWHVGRHALWQIKATRPIAYCGPTWSWASALAPVEYWPDVVNYQDTVQHFLRGLAKSRDRDEEHTGVETPLILNRAKIHCTVNVPGHNIFGSVDAGVLTVEASCTSAWLKSTDVGIKLQEDQSLDLMSYSLLVSTDTSEGASLAEIPFFADYSLELEGPRRLYDGAELTILLVHPEVSLVLRQKVLNDKCMYIDGNLVWERIGISRRSEGLNDTRSVDWMRHSEVKTLKIV